MNAGGGECRRRVSPSSCPNGREIVSFIAMTKDSAQRDDVTPVIVTYTREQAIADGVLVPTGLIGFRGGKFVQVCFTAHLFADFKDGAKRGRLVREGLKALKHPDPEDTRYRLLRVLRKRYWVILDGDGITFLYPDDY